MKTNLAFRCGLCGGPCADGSGVCLGCDYPAEWDDDPDDLCVLTATPPVPLCTICHNNAVDAANGYDTCPDCFARM